MKKPYAKMLIECQYCDWHASGLVYAHGDVPTFAMECAFCAATGAFAFDYLPFIGRVARADIQKVFPHTGKIVTPAIDGGMDYDAWCELSGDAALLKDAAQIELLTPGRYHFPKVGTRSLATACRACDATGLFVGLAERDGAAVPCVDCDGTGCQTAYYDDFEKRKRISGITRVFPRSAVTLYAGVLGGTPYPVWWESGLRSGAEPREVACPMEFFEKDLSLWSSSASPMRADAWCFLVQPRSARWGSTCQKCPAHPENALCWQVFDEGGAPTDAQQVELRARLPR